MYLLLIGTERCCDVAAVGGCVVVCACVCGGDGCVGDTTNACTMYRVMGVWLWVSVWPAGSTYSRSIVMFLNRLFFHTQSLIHFTHRRTN